MKIGKPADLQQTDASSRAAKAAPGAPASGHSAGGAVEQASAVDAVHLSRTSRNLAAEHAAAGMPVRTEKVEEVREAIREGRFHVSAHAIAQKMITQAAELLETLSRKK